VTGRVEVFAGAAVDTTTALVVVVEESGTLEVATVWAVADPGLGSVRRMHAPRVHDTNTTATAPREAALALVSSAPRPFPGPAPRSPARS